MGEENATMVFFYYIGHGVCQSLTSALFNSKTGVFFPIEFELFTLSQQRGTYVLSVFDGSRYQVAGLPNSNLKIPE